MIVSKLAAIIDALKADATLQGYLGGQFVYRAKRISASDTPCITVKDAGETSRKRTCYIVHKNRDNAATVTVDVWVNKNSESFPSTGEDADTIANRVDVVLLMTQITGTRAWEKVSSNPFFEDDTGLFHVALRYSFEYSLTES